MINLKNKISKIKNFSYDPDETIVDIKKPDGNILYSITGEINFDGKNFEGCLIFDVKEDKIFFFTDHHFFIYKEEVSLGELTLADGTFVKKVSLIKE